MTTMPEKATMKSQAITSVVVLCLASACSKAPFGPGPVKPRDASPGADTPTADIAGEPRADGREPGDDLTADRAPAFVDAPVEIPAPDTGADVIDRDSAGPDMAAVSPDIDPGPLDFGPERADTDAPAVNEDAVVDARVGKDGARREAATEAGGPLACTLAPGGFLPMAEVGYNPSSLVLADVNLDGTLDAVVANSSSATVSVLLGQGNGTFAAATDYHTGSPFSDDGKPEAGPSYATLGDLNADGAPDIVAVNDYAGTVSVLLGNGDGTFGKATDFPTGKSPSPVSLGDLNGDGVLDLVTANPGAGTVSVLLGKGDGSFAGPTAYPCGGGPVTVALSDLDGDGALDLVTANPGAGTVSVLLGKSDGRFADHRDYPAGDRPGQIALGDLNGDGRLDLVVENQPAGMVSVLLATGSGSLAAPASFTATAGSPPIYQSPALLALADVNADRMLDLVVAWRDGGEVNVLLGQGDGRFAPPSGHFSPSQLRAAALGDLDGDGRLDIAIVLRFGRAGWVSTLLGNDDGTFVASPEYPAAEDPYALALGDLDGDGNLDVVTAGYTRDYTGIASVRLGTVGVGLAERTDYVLGNIPVAVALGDATGDGKPDIVTANYPAKSVSVMAGVGNGTFAGGVDLATGDTPRAVALADLNGDGKLDIVTAGSEYDQEGSVSVLLGKGGGNFATRFDRPSGFNPTAVALADLDGDHKLDMVVAASATSYEGSLDVLLGKGDGTFSGQLTYAGGSFVTSLVLVDLNGDGKLDIVTGMGDVGVLLGQGDGSFAEQVVYPTEGNGGTVAIGDVTGDGKLDIVVGHPAAMKVLPGKGDGTFAAMVVYPVAADAPALADLNRDGRLDIVALAGSNVSVLLNSCR
jgi:hypothetical protein